MLCNVQVKQIFEILHKFTKRRRIKMIDWLMQRTADGATYLQVVIIMTLWLLVIYLIYCSICDYVESDIYNDEDGD